MQPATDWELAAAELLEAGQHADPFGVLGPHADDGVVRVRCFQPQASAVDLLEPASGSATPMRRVGTTGLFVADRADSSSGYRLRLTPSDGTVSDIDDPYRFSSPLGALDLHLIGEGSHHLLYEKLGAHAIRLDAVDGISFAVWAPNAGRVSVVGDFNDWDGRRHVMRRHPAVGTWDIFVPGLKPGALYKYELLDADGRLLPLKADPFAFYCEASPGNASIVFASEHRWQDTHWREAQDRSLGFEQPISIYEVQLGSWRRKPEAGNRCLNYVELADELIPYVLEMGFTHIELLPVSDTRASGNGTSPIFASTTMPSVPSDPTTILQRFTGRSAFTNASRL
jgi:1,4-alpha-glucan branching enzyme